MICFNCATTEKVARYSLDMDLPTFDACQMCKFALTAGDEEMLADLRPRTPKKARKATEGSP